MMPEADHLHRMANGDSGGQKHFRRLRRLREKLQRLNGEPEEADVARPTVIRVGTLSSTVRSGKSLGGSWRLMDDLFQTRGAGTVGSMRSVASDKTMVYEDDDGDKNNNDNDHQRVSVDKPNFRTVVELSEPDSVQQSACPTVVRVNVSDPDELLVSDQDDDRDQHRESAGNDSPAEVNAEVVVVEPETTGKRTTDGQQHLSQSSAHQRRVGESSDANLGLLTSTRSRVIVQDDDHWSARSRASTSSPAIRLTSYRLRCDDSIAIENSIESIDTRGSDMFPSPIANLPQPITFAQCRRLAPEDLPRMYPAWQLAAPTCFEEQLDEESKGCCGSGRLFHSAFVRLFIVIISIIGISCVIVGVVMGALIVSGSARLTLCLLMIGVGIVLITVSAVAWRLTSFESDGCGCLGRSCLLRCCWFRSRRRRSIFVENSHSRMAYRRVENARRRGGFCSPNLLHSEFAWRPPPPTYQASVQEARLQSFLMSRHNYDTLPSIGSPPPTYRSHGEDTSRPSVIGPGPISHFPPSYRSNENRRSPSLSDFVVCVPPNADGSDTGGSCVLTSEPVQHDDRESLVRNEHAQRPTLANTNGGLTVSEPLSGNGQSSATGVDRLAVIDCSAPMPIGFEIRNGPMFLTRPDVRRLPPFDPLLTRMPPTIVSMGGRRMRFFPPRPPVVNGQQIPPPTHVLPPPAANNNNNEPPAYCNLRDSTGFGRSYV